MAGRGRGERVVNPIPRRLVRRRISRAETAAGVVILVVLATVAVWIHRQGRAFDPASRDISFQTLQRSSVADTLYRTPIKRWADPTREGAGPGQPDLGLFPPALLEGGWSLDGRVETYDPENLYVKIDGAAEQYLAFGFRELFYVTLAREGQFLTLELYDQGRMAHALGVFARQRDETRKVLSAEGVHYVPTTVGAIGIRDRYFFKLAADRPSESVVAKTQQVLRLIAGLPAGNGGGGARDDELSMDLLSVGLGIPFERIAFQKENVFQYDFLEEFWFGVPESGRDLRVFLHGEVDASAAGALLTRLVEEQSGEYEILERGEHHALLRHEFLGSFFAAGTRGRMLYGLEHAQDEATARAWIRRLEEVIGEKARR